MNVSSQEKLNVRESKTQSNHHHSIPIPLIEVVESLEGVLELSRRFKRRLQSAQPNPFASWDWYCTWLESFPEKYDRIRFVLFASPRSDGKQGEICYTIFPMVQKGNTLDFAGAELGDFQDVLTENPDSLANALNSVMNWARENQLEIRFTKLSDRGFIKPVLEGHLSKGKLLLHKKHLGPCPHFQIPEGGLNTVLAGFGKSTRKGIRRRLRNIQGTHGCQFSMTDRLDSSFLEEAAKIHQNLQINKAGDSIFDRPAMVEFLLKMSESPEVGLVASSLRTKDGEMVAFELGYQLEKTYFAWVAAYEPKYSDLRPGTCAMALLVDCLSTRGVETFDFLCGAEQYKYQYAKHEYHIHDVIVSPDNTTNRLQMNIRKIHHDARQKVKRTLLNLGLLKTNYRVTKH